MGAGQRCIRDVSGWDLRCRSRSAHTLRKRPSTVPPGSAWSLSPLHRCSIVASRADSEPQPASLHRRRQTRAALPEWLPRSLLPQRVSEVSPRPTLLVRTSDSCVDIEKCGKSSPRGTWEFENLHLHGCQRHSCRGRTPGYALSVKSQFSVTATAKLIRKVRVNRPSSAGGLPQA